MSSPVLNEERARPYEKPVTTKDIANLYSHLQTMIDNVPKSPRLETNTELPITPTTSSSLSRSSPLKPDCPCHHILVSKDSRHCALCDDVIPILADIQQDREKKQKDIAELKQQLFAQETKSKSSRIELLAQQKKYQQTNDQLQKTKEQYANVKKDLSVLQQKYETEKKEADEVKRAKASVENELEELSQKLFEEANGMVATEKRAKHLLEIQYQRLKQELESCKHQMEAEELQLKELKSKMGDMEEQHKREHRLSNNGSCISTADEEDDSQEKRASRDMANLFHHPEEIIDEDPTDPLILNEFKEFVESGESIPIRKIHSMPYMKNSLTDDVEPCLRFGPNSRLSARKLYEAILLNTCFIEESPYGFAQDQAKRPYDVPLRISAAKNLIWERLSTPTAAPPFAGCQACGRSSKSDLPYRFRISMLDDWACIDRYCRDRLVSVCEFYMFIRNVRQGYYNGRTIPDLYRESTRLKLQMFYARMGTLSQALYRVGVKGDIIGHASAPNMVIPPPIKIKHADGNNPVDEISATSSDISDISAKVSDDEQEEDSPARRSSMHPGNSVWIAHSF
ncbi:hypothetical protein [Parasitella parasitica]|uniref:GDP/GTP exchange factor Sec2 N-terminal domain-containing protein n=1 Tax=Parasitella parasitica TaxID=35722 RepID=A0A0B7NHY7_9FUNG|nr:hypothetical protein [Parasitella parasitica]